MRLQSKQKSQGTPKFNKEQFKVEKRYWSYSYYYMSMDESFALKVGTHANSKNVLLIIKKYNYLLQQKIMAKKNATKIILTLFILFTISAYGQTKKKQNERDTTKQWEIGLDLLWLISKNQVPSTSLFTRYNYINTKSKYRALRLRVGMDNNFYDSAQVNNLSPYEINTLSILLRPGVEFQKKLSKKSYFFYGTDLHFFLFKQTFYNIFNSSIPDPNVYEGRFQTIEAGLIPFVGLKYYPADWCTISIESSLNCIYRIKRDKSQTGTVAYPGSGGKSERNVDDFNINISPITVLNFSFIINKKQNER